MLGSGIGGAGRNQVRRVGMCVREPDVEVRDAHRRQRGKRNGGEHRGEQLFHADQHAEGGADGRERALRFADCIDGLAEGARLRRHRILDLRRGRGRHVRGGRMRSRDLRGIVPREELAGSLDAELMRPATPS